MNINNFCEATESSIINHKDHYYNMNEWKKEKDKNVLYITGLTSSGKSTFGKKIAEETGAEYIDCDIFYDRIRADHLKLSDKNTFINKTINSFYSNPEFNITKQELDNLTDYERYALYQNMFNWIHQYFSKYPSKLFVFEGIWVYLYFDFEYLKNKPLIIKGTSAYTSFKRSNKRVGFIAENHKEYRREFAQYKAQDIELSKLINYMDDNAIKNKSFDVRGNK